MFYSFCIHSMDICETTLFVHAMMRVYYNKRLERRERERRETKEMKESINPKSGSLTFEFAQWTGMTLGAIVSLSFPHSLVLYHFSFSLHIPLSLSSHCFFSFQLSRFECNLCLYVIQFVIIFLYLSTHKSDQQEIHHCILLLHPPFYREFSGRFRVRFHSNLSIIRCRYGK